MRRIFQAAGPAALLAWCFATTAMAAEPPGDSDGAVLPYEGGYITALMENDWFGISDRNYTSGGKLSYVSAGRDVTRADGVAGPTTLHWVAAFGQSIFTPEAFELAEPPVGQHPYAAHSYLEGGLIFQSPRQLDTVVVQAGVVGPSALGEEAQNLVHIVLGGEEANGWDTQIPDMGAVNVYFDTHRRGPKGRLINGWAFDVAPHAGFALGNVHTHAHAGAVVRMGPQLDEGFGQMRVRPDAGAAGGRGRVGLHTPRRDALARSRRVPGAGGSAQRVHGWQPVRGIRA